MNRFTCLPLLINAVLMSVFLDVAFASPTPGISKIIRGNSVTQYQQTSEFAAMGFSAPLSGEGHINGQVTNKCPYPIYVRQAIAEYSGVTGKGCQHFGETADRKIDPGATYIVT